jgi:hypothetical protein
MKVPTDATKVFSPNLYTEIVTNPTELTTSFPTDLNVLFRRNSASGGYWTDRLRGSTTSANGLLTSFDTASEFSYGVSPFLFDNNTGVKATYLFNNTSGSLDVDYQFRRAPSFFDEVCYDGSTFQLTVTHNLQVAPQLIITKARNNVDDWYVWCQYNSSISTGACISPNSNSSTASSAGGTISSLTSTTFKTYLPGTTGVSAVSYLFATCAGVSKVGSYTGTGTLTTINCGFTGGARFVMIKRTNASANWFIWDTSRGMVNGTDPSLALNTTSAESNANSVYTATTGFQLLASPSADVNTSGGTYIYLAIA